MKNNEFEKMVCLFWGLKHNWELRDRVVVESTGLGVRIIFQRHSLSAYNSMLRYIGSYCVNINEDWSVNDIVFTIRAKKYILSFPIEVHEEINQDIKYAYNRYISKFNSIFSEMYQLNENKFIDRILYLKKMNMRTYNYTDITTVGVICKICKKEIVLKTDTSLWESFEWHLKHKHQEEYRVYKYGTNINTDLEMQTPTTMKCIKNHISYMSPTQTIKYNKNEKIECRICQIEKEFVFFEILNKLNCIYKIEETFSNYLGNRKLKQLSKLDILLFNKKNHVIGKIVFDDYSGEKQAKSNANNVTFAWFELKYVNDRNYCIRFFHDFHKKIIKKYNLKQSE